MSMSEIQRRENQRKDSKQEEGEQGSLVRPRKAKELGRRGAQDKDGGYPPVLILEHVNWNEMPRSWSQEAGMQVTLKRRHSIPNPKPMRSTITNSYLALVFITQEVEFADQGINVKNTRQVSLRLASDDVSENERKLFYETLLRLRRLPVRVRAAVVKEIGYSTRLKESRYQRQKTQFLLLQITACKCRLQREREAARCYKKYVSGGKGILVRGSLYDLSIEKVSAMHGMTPAALKKRIERYRNKMPQRGRPREVGTKVIYKRSNRDDDRNRAPKKAMLTGTRLALMPVIKQLEFGYKRLTVKETHGPPVWLDSDNVDEKNKLLCDKLLRIGWLPAKLRASVMREAGYLTREQEAERRQSYTQFLWDEVKKCECSLRHKLGEARSYKNANITDCNNKYLNLNGGRIQDPRQRRDGVLPPPEMVQGNSHALAIKEIATRYDMTPAALKKRIQRHRSYP
jgi:hypothetical protein